MTSANEPEKLLNQHTFDNRIFTNGIVGAAVKGDSLYILLAPYLDLWLPDPSTNITLAVLSLENLPSLTALGESAATVRALESGLSYEPLWCADDLLVWVATREHPFFVLHYFAGGTTGGFITFNDSPLQPTGVFPMPTTSIRLRLPN